MHKEPQNSYFQSNFKIDNGKEGDETCRHTATGYECTANYPRVQNNHTKKAKFLVRHVVGGDGKPYTEIGLTGLEESQFSHAITEIKNLLKTSGFRETKIMEGKEDIEAFIDYGVVESGWGVAVRASAKTCSIKKAVEIMDDLLPELSRKFIYEQEDIDDVLFQSLLSTLGPELKKSRGGDSYAIEKIRKLASEFKYGLDIRPVHNSPI